MRWNQVQKRLEDLLAESVKGKIKIKATAYRDGWHHRVWMLYNDSQIFTTTAYWWGDDWWDDNSLTSQFENANIFIAYCLSYSLHKYIFLSFEDILKSNNFYIRALSMLDKRRGKRRLRDLDVSAEHDLTKKISHHFLLAPPHYSINAALRWGQVHALGGDQILADALLDTKLIDDFRDDKFCQSVISFFIRHPMLDRELVNPIIDYIWNQKFEERTVFVEPGVAQTLPPVRPNFSMRGRIPETLLREVRAWHEELGKAELTHNLKWLKSDVQEFQFTEGSNENKNLKIWRIQELLSGRELIDEGKALKHCVASYAQSCYKGKCSIWSLNMDQGFGIEKILTIKVRTSSKEIRKVRGFKDRLPETHEKNIIKRWADREDLEYAKEF